MMKKILFFLLFAILSINFSPAAAQSIEDVYEFDSFEVEILQDGKYYTGILLSEIEYDFYTKLKFKYNLLSEQLKVWEEFGGETRSLLDENIKNSKDILKDLNSIKKEVIYESWWERNKFEIGVASGVLATVAVIFIVDAIRNE